MKLRYAILILIGLLVPALAAQAQEDFDAILNAASEYEQGHSRAPLVSIAEHVRRATNDNAYRSEIEPKLAAALSADGTDQTKGFICRQLALIGTADSVRALADLLNDPALSHMARIALEKIKGPEATFALLDAVGAAQGDIRIGIINTLGARGDNRAANGLITRLAQANDPDMAAALADALAQLATLQGADAILEAIDRDRTDARLIDALIRCTDKISQRGFTNQTVALYQNAQSRALNEQQRLATVRGITTARGSLAAPTLARLFTSEDQCERDLARELIRTIQARGMTKALVDRLGRMEGAAQALMAEALGMRGDAAAGPGVAKLLSSPDPEVRLAAIRALATIGAVGTGADLARFAAEAQEEEAAAARQSIYALRATGVDSALQAGLASAEPMVRVELLAALAHRRVRDTAQELLDLFTGLAHNRDKAFAGAIGAIALHELRPTKASIALYSGALAAADTDQQRRAVLDSLGTLHNQHALDLVLDSLDSAALAQSAARSAIQIARAIGDEYRHEALDAIDRAIATTDDTEVRLMAGEAASHIDRNVGFITQWVIAGPFSKEGINGSAIFDEVFAPEPGSDDGPTDWKPAPDPVSGSAGIFNLLEIGSGNDRCAYARTQVLSNKARDALLQIGSDDGVKVWLNGQIVHENNAMRGLTLNQDQVSIRLEEGLNTLLLKITQGGGDWRFACRIRDADGFALEGVRFDAR